ncbi:hypothetical protein M9H77_07079 [Catharanthus roseus]|uniref:Uncharacterized protein n=1 Tax=Catharanthus roseus TaxID=4058 RepID=A0ACC0BTX2_CATRO|nr:hypothetical protein M9H77_07079 [Catharanthus roseus]
MGPKNEQIFVVMIPLLHISGDYYPDLVREFYANMTHQMNKDLRSITSNVKGVRITLNRERLASILRIPNNGNSITVDSNRKTIDEDLDWNFDIACSRFEIRPRALDRHRIIRGDNFPNLLHLLPISLGTHSSKRGAALDKENQVWIRPFEEDRLLDRNPASFHKIKKPTKPDDDEADESYNPSDDEEYEAGAQNTILIDVFQTEMQTAFEQLRINQEVQGMWLTEIVESTHRYADESAHQRASTDRQEVMLAQVCQRFMPDQGNSGGGGTDFGPQ